MNPAVSCSAQLAGESLAAAELLCVRTNESFFIATIDGRRVAGDDCRSSLVLNHLVVPIAAVPGGALLGGVCLAAAILLCIRASVLFPTATYDWRQGVGDGSAFGFALALGCEVVLVVLADVELPRHRDIIFLHQSRGCCHAILDILEEIGGPEGVLVRRADPSAQT